MGLPLGIYFFLEGAHVERTYIKYTPGARCSTLCDGKIGGDAGLDVFLFFFSFLFGIYICKHPDVLGCLIGFFKLLGFLLVLSFLKGFGGFVMFFSLIHIKRILDCMLSK